MAPLNMLSIFWLIVGLALAGLDVQSTTNLAVYWGQGPTQKSLAEYCNDDSVDVLIISFLDSLTDGQGNFAPELNLGNQCADTKACTQVQEDIKTCQSQGKTILLSMGGANSPEKGFADDTDGTKAKEVAKKLWEMFGPVSSNNTAGTERPFGSAVIDGFDFDFETEIPGMGPFGTALHGLMEGQNKYITAAPQCALPTQTMYNEIPLDMAFVQYYNNPQCNQNFGDWDNWAKQKNTKWALGLPGSSSAAGSGYVEPGGLNALFAEAKAFESLSGAMLWGASESWDNDGYQKEVKTALQGGKKMMFRA